MKAAEVKERLKHVNDVSTSRIRAEATDGASVSQDELPTRIPLRHVVRKCVAKWHKETVKAAEEGDVNMQILLGQMLMLGYSAPLDKEKGEFWLRKAAEVNPEAGDVLKSFGVEGPELSTELVPHAKPNS